MSLLGFNALGKHALGQGRDSIAAFRTLSPIGNITIAATTVAKDNAVVGYTIPAITFVGTATALAKASVTLTIANFTPTISALGGNNARLSVTMAAVTISATARGLIQAALAKTLSPITLAATGTVTSHAVGLSGFGNVTSNARVTAWYTFPSIPPDFPVSVKRDINLLENGYGAYKERAPFGIYANQNKQVQLRWGSLTESQRVVLETFLKQRGGAGRFKYVMPHWDGLDTWVCPRWSFGYAMEAADGDGSRRFTLSATFERRFDPTQG